MMSTAVKREHLAPVGADSAFDDNVEYLEALIGETAHAIAARLGAAPDGAPKGLAQPRTESGLALPDPSAPDHALRSALEQVRETNRRRLARSRDRGLEIRFEVLAARFGLDPTEREILGILCGGALSREFCDWLGAWYGVNCSPEPGDMAVGDLVRLITPGFSAGIRSRRYFFDGSRLRTSGLIAAADPKPAGGVAAARMRVPQRLLDHLLGESGEFLPNLEGIALELPRVDWNKLILPARDKDLIRKTVAAYPAFLEKSRRLGMEQCISYGLGLTMLFYGPSGTGKTLTAKAVASMLGRPLMTLRTTQNTYDEEDAVTRMFGEAAALDAVVFFDECEDLFPKGSHLSYLLLTEIERRNGITILASNNVEELDRAIERRLSLRIEFAQPDLESRTRIWRSLIPTETPLAADVDLEELACAYPFNGGYIKNAVLSAMQMALFDDGGREFEVSMGHLRAASDLQCNEAFVPRRFPPIRAPRAAVDSISMFRSDPMPLPRIKEIVAGYKAAQARGRLPRFRGVETTRGVRILITAPTLSMASGAAESLAAALGWNVWAVPFEEIMDNESSRFQASPYRSPFHEDALSFSDTLRRTRNARPRIILLEDGQAYLGNYCDNELQSRLLASRLEALRDVEETMVFASAHLDGLPPNIRRRFHYVLEVESSRAGDGGSIWDAVRNSNITKADELDWEGLGRELGIRDHEAPAVGYRAWLDNLDARGESFVDAESVAGALRRMRIRGWGPRPLFGAGP